MRAHQISFDTSGESNETLVHDTHPPVFIRLAGDPPGTRSGYVALTERTGLPLSGSEYDESASLDDLLDTLARRGYRLA